MLQCVGASLVRLSQTSVVQGFGPPDRLALQWDRKGSGLRYMAMKNKGTEYYIPPLFGLLGDCSLPPDVFGRLGLGHTRVTVPPPSCISVKKQQNVNG
jgi:hypothetical protein